MNIIYCPGDDDKCRGYFMIKRALLQGRHAEGRNLQLAHRIQEFLVVLRLGYLVDEEFHGFRT